MAFLIFVALKSVEAVTGCSSFQMSRLQVLGVEPMAGICYFIHDNVAFLKADVIVGQASSAVYDIPIGTELYVECRENTVLNLYLGETRLQLSIVAVLNGNAYNHTGSVGELGQQLSFDIKCVPVVTSTMAATLSPSITEPASTPQTDTEPEEPTDNTIPEEPTDNTKPEVPTDNTKPEEPGVGLWWIACAVALAVAVVLLMWWCYSKMQHSSTPNKVALDDSLANSADMPERSVSNFAEMSRRAGRFPTFNERTLPLALQRVREERGQKSVATPQRSTESLILDDTVSRRAKPFVKEVRPKRPQKEKRKRPK